MKFLRNIILALGVFIVTSIIAGQIIMWGQGDTPLGSVMWGLMYVVYGCGIPQALKGEWVDIITVVIQFAAALGILFTLEVRRRRLIKT